MLNKCKFNNDDNKNKKRINAKFKNTLSHNQPKTYIFLGVNGERYLSLQQNQNRLDFKCQCSQNTKSQIKSVSLHLHSILTDYSSSEVCYIV